MTVVYLGLAFLPEFALLAEQVERFVFQEFRAKQFRSGAAKTQ